MLFVSAQARWPASNATRAEVLTEERACEANDDRVREFLRHGSLVFAGLIAANVLTYVFYATVARAVGVDEAGLFTSLISAMLVLALPGTVAATIVAKIAADARAGGRSGIPVFLARRIVLLALPFGALVVILLFVKGTAIGAFFHANDPAVTLLAAAGFVLTLLIAPQRAVLQGIGNFGGFSASNIVEGVVKALTGVAVLRLGGGLRVALAGYLVAVSSAFCFNAALTVRGATEAFEVTRAGLARNFFRIAVPIAAITAMTFADAVLARHFLSSREAGLYGATALVGRAMLTVIAFVPTVLLPKAAARARAGEAPLPLLLAALGVTGIAVGSMLAVVWAAPVFVVTTIAGRDFAGAGNFMLPYAAAMAGLAGTAVLSTYLIGVDRHGFAFPVSVIAAAEVGAMTLWHPGINAFLTIVLTGHFAALTCCLADTSLSLLRPARALTAVEVTAPPA